MQHSRIVFALLLSAAVILAACGRRSDEPATAAADTPHGTVLIAVGAMKTGDLEAFLKNAMPEADYAAARKDWEAARTGALDPQEEAELNATLARLQADDAVDTLMAEIEPRLAEVRGQLPLLLGIAQTVGHAGISNSEELTDDQKTAANELLGAMGRWAGGRDLADPELAREAVVIAVQAGRSLELESASDLQALEFEEMMQRAGIMFRASKDMLRVYGLDVDAMLDSVTAETLSEDGDRAMVRMRFEFLETNQKIDFPMVRRNGRWYSEDASLEFHEAGPAGDEEA